jgi:zinc transporter, ZIP family
MTLALTLTLALAAGLSIPVGALISSNLSLKSLCLRYEIDSFVSYFGGGALLAALALVLIPSGIEYTSALSASAAFFIGSLVFWQFSSWAARTGNTASQFISMVLDFIPEAILLGVAAAAGSGVAYLLAGLMALQNMPEGFSAYHEMHESEKLQGWLWVIFLSTPLLGPIAAGLGFAWLSESKETIGLLMLFCSGGILYLIFQDIAPRAYLKHHNFPAIGAVSGFLLGMIGTMLIH